VLAGLFLYCNTEERNLFTFV